MNLKSGDRTVMMPITRPELEILLDTPDRRDYVVSAFADLRVRDGFRSFVDVHVRNQARSAHGALSEADARKALDENLAPIERALANADSSARGLAIFSGAQRQLFHVVNLPFPVENELVIDEDPFVLPLLERWYGDPTYLVAVIDTHHLHLFEAHSGVTEEVKEIDRDIPEMQRDKARFTYKKRFAKAFDERLQKPDQDEFFKGIADAIAEHWKTGAFTGLILLGSSTNTSAVHRLLDKEIGAQVVEEHAQTMTSKPADVADDVERAMNQWREQREDQVLGELRQRWKENHLVANGTTEVLDALQQGRATQVVIGPRRDLPGARCFDCGYRFGAPVATCVYCQGQTRSINAIQEILRMALRHRIPVHLFDRQRPEDPLASVGGVSALLRAEANWAPDKSTAEATQGNG